MKKTLLFLLFAGTSVVAQTPIAHYQGVLDFPPGMPLADGWNWRTYTRLESETPLDHSASGANAVWTFNGMSENEILDYYNEPPTAGEVSAFPGATMRTQLVSSGNVMGVEYKSDNGSTVLAMQNFQFALTYTNPASLGAFPLSYGYTNTDAVAGTYEYDGYSGTFSGNLVTSVDAYGTLSDDFTAIPIPVTRLKTVQTLTINYVPFGNVGTVVITSYWYYNLAQEWSGNRWPFFKSTATAISVPLLGVNETMTLLEKQSSVFALSDREAAKKNNVTLSPNPANDIVNLAFAEDFALQSVTVSDLTGKTVLAKRGNASGVDISKLQPGIYMMTIRSESGSETHKFVKK